MHCNRVLFVEDNLMLAMLNTAFFRECGFDVVHVANAADAIEAISQGPPLGALVTDVHLGPGPSGFDVARLARTLYPALQVVFASGVNSARAFSEGVEGAMFVSKPFHPQEIVEALAPAPRRDVA